MVQAFHLSQVAWVCQGDIRPVTMKVVVVVFLPYLSWVNALWILWDLGVLLVIVGENDLMARSDQRLETGDQFSVIDLSSSPCPWTCYRVTSHATYESVLGVEENDFFVSRDPDGRMSYVDCNRVFPVYLVLDSANVRVYQMVQNLGGV
jgi:hypothetical protein